jgi:prefoldin subunit 5
MSHEKLSREELEYQYSKANFLIGSLTAQNDALRWEISELENTVSQLRKQLTQRNADELESNQ